jgi:hypothetical protein
LRTLWVMMPALRIITGTLNWWHCDSYNLAAMAFHILLYIPGDGHYRNLVEKSRHLIKVLHWGLCTMCWVLPHWTQYHLIQFFFLPDSCLGHSYSSMLWNAELCTGTSWIRWIDNIGVLFEADWNTYVCVQRLGTK